MSKKQSETIAALFSGGLPDYLLALARDNFQERRSEPEMRSTDVLIINIEQQRDRIAALTDDEAQEEARTEYINHLSKSRDDVVEAWGKTATVLTALERLSQWRPPTGWEDLALLAVEPLKRECSELISSDLGSAVWMAKARLDRGLPSGAEWRRKTVQTCDDSIKSLGMMPRLIEVPTRDYTPLHASLEALRLQSG